MPYIVGRDGVRQIPRGPELQTNNVLIICHKLLNLTLHPLVSPRARFPPSVCLPAQLRKVVPRLGDHSLQLPMLFSPNGELQYDRFKFVMEIARCPL